MQFEKYSVVPLGSLHFNCNSARKIPSYRKEIVIQWCLWQWNWIICSCT